VLSGSDQIDGSAAVRGLTVKTEIRNSGGFGIGSPHLNRERAGRYA